MKIHGNCTLWLLALLSALGCVGAPDGSEAAADDQTPVGKTEQKYSFGSYYGGPGGDPWTIGTPYSNIRASWYGTINGTAGTVLETGNLTWFDLGGCWDNNPSGITVGGQMYYAGGQILYDSLWFDSWPTDAPLVGGLHKGHTCPAGEYIIGIWGRSGAYVDRLSSICGTPDHSQVEYNYDFCGTSTGGSLFIEYCPVGMIATGFTGRGGSWLDGIQMYCNTPYVPPPLIY